MEDSALRRISCLSQVIQCFWLLQARTWSSQNSSSLWLREFSISPFSSLHFWSDTFLASQLVCICPQNFSATILAWVLLTIPRLPSTSLPLASTWLSYCRAYIGLHGWHWLSRYSRSLHHSPLLTWFRGYLEHVIIVSKRLRVSCLLPLSLVSSNTVEYQCGRFTKHATVFPPSISAWLVLI